MKRFLCCFICIVLGLPFAGCNSNDNSPLLSGSYYAVGNYEEMLTPYIWLDTSTNAFSLGPGAVVSYAEHGTYEIENGTIIATSQSTIFKFEIKNTNTLVLIDNGDNEYFKIPINTQFVFSKDLK